MASFSEVTIQQSPPSLNLRPSTTTQADFERLCETFDRAVIAHPEEYVESFFLLAGKVVCFRVVGRTLSDIYRRSFAPRAILPTNGSAPVTPSLTIKLWDESVTGIPYPLTMMEVDGNPFNIGEGLVPSSDEGRRWVCLERKGSATWLDRKMHQMVGYRANVATITTYERSKPLLTLLTLWLYDQDIHILHAGMVARKGKGLLITGNSGFGKSTTSLLCLLAGFDYLSDDHVALVRPERNSSAFVAYSVFQSARILPKSLMNFPTLQAHAIPSIDESDPKLLLLLAEIFPEQIVDHATITAIALPRFSRSATTSFSRATRANALNYIVQNSLYSSFATGRLRFEYVIQLLGNVPTYWLDLGHDFAGIPVAIDQLLEQVA